MHSTTCRCLLALLLVAAFPVASGEAAPTARAEATTLVLATATPGGGFRLFGQTLADVINATDPTLRLEAIATQGSIENLALLEAGTVDIGLVEGNAAREALQGLGRKPADLKVLSVMYPNPGMFVVRADSPYQRIEDLKARPVAFGTRASGLRLLANDVLDGIGLNPETDFKPVVLERAADGPRLLLKGKVEGLWGAGIGWPGFVRAADSAVGARFIAPTGEQVEQILTRHPHLRAMSVPAGSYRGQKQRIDSVGLWSLILTRPQLPDALAYRLADAIHHGARPLSARLAQGRFTTMQNTATQVPAEHLHPGVARYLRERGLSD